MSKVKQEAENTVQFKFPDGTETAKVPMSQFKAVAKQAAEKVISQMKQEEFKGMPEKSKGVKLAEWLLAQRVRVKEAADLEKEIQTQLCEEMTLAKTPQLLAQTPDGVTVVVVHQFKEGIVVRKPGGVGAQQ